MRERSRFLVRVGASVVFLVVAVEVVDPLTEWVCGPSPSGPDTELVQLLWMFDCMETVLIAAAVCLLAAGFVAGLILRAPAGLMTVTITLMSASFLLMFKEGNREVPFAEALPVILVSGLLSCVPALVGYGLGRAVIHASDGSLRAELAKFRPLGDHVDDTDDGTGLRHFF